ncbi:MAG: hypothetical protein GF331_20255 [Chitinivibrionales bacterium]|nr:hypothetical protein [Chitinivibrionales bacterium]
MDVEVPQELVSLDSVVGQRHYFSGTAQYTLVAAQDSLIIHVYLEYVPIARYLNYPFLGEYEVGHAPMQCIDSLCDGDVGWVKPGRDLQVRWRYSTVSATSHCRIKIGLANYLYANTSRRMGTDVKRYEYNRLGELARTITSTISAADTVVVDTAVPLYTVHGQMTVDDTSAPYNTIVYDSLGRAVLRQRASPDGLIWHYTYGYGYDSAGRATHQYHLPFGTSVYDWDAALNRDRYTYDALGRLSYCDSYLSARQFPPECGGFTFDGLSTAHLSYQGTGETVTRRRQAYIDTARGDTLVRIQTDYYHGGFAAGPDSAVANTTYLGPVGTCWGSDKGMTAVKSVHSYDWTGRQVAVDYYSRTAADSPWVYTGSKCTRAVYDASGNTIEQYDFCRQEERLQWEATFDQYNYRQRLIQYHGVGTSDTTWMVWELLDLDTLEEPNYE